MCDVTRILNAIEQGDARASDELLPIVYQELRRLAGRKLSHESPGQTLDATALVHEAYLRLVGLETRHWGSRAHFFAAAAEAMRRILVERARRKRRIKHGGGRERFELNENDAATEPASLDLIALNDALERLTEHDMAKADVVKFHYFAGLSLAETAAFLGISRATASRYWAYARAWLYREMTRR